MADPASPGRFLWGAATSAHQVEGGNDRNDWWDWDRLAGERYGDLVDLWITINEPEVLAFRAYDEGAWPPGVRDRSRALLVMANLLEAHGFASAALRQTDRVDADGDGAAARIGVAKHWALVEPLRRWFPLDRISASIQHRVFNVAVARALSGQAIDLSIPGARPVRRRA